MFSSFVPGKMDLRAGNDLTLLGSTEEISVYDMTGGDPNFQMEWPGGELSAGLYELMIDFPDGIQSLMQPTLYVDSGSGYNERECVALSFYAQQDRYAAAILLEKGAKALRFDPSCQPGRLTIGSVYLGYVSTIDNLGDLPVSRPHISQAINQQRSLAALSLENGIYKIAEDKREYVFVPPQEPADIGHRLASLSTKPTFSIVVPSYNTPEPLMQKLLGSVIGQWYPHWELIIVDDASPNPQAKDLLDRLTDPRIKVYWQSENRGIAGATNAGIEVASGEYVVLLDHDDELTLDCLFELALCVDAYDADYIYSDEDKIDLDGRFSMPHFKPDWSPDTMMSTMYVCHVSCIRRQLLLDIGGLRSKYDGCQDWDLILRLTEKTQNIRHIPKVLYHWRIIPGSVAGALTEKPYVLDASRRVREDALQRRGLAGTVEPLDALPGYFSVNYHVRGEPLVSIIIPTRDNVNVLRRCVDSLVEKATYPHKQIVIVDNGSVDKTTIDYLRVLSESKVAVVVRSHTPFNFSALCNIGASHSDGDFLLFLNDDTEVITPDFLERMIGYAQLPHIGAAGAKLLYPNSNRVQHSGVLNLAKGPVHAFLGSAPDMPGYFVRNLLEYNWLAVTGACLMVQKTKFERVAGFDENFPIAYNDVDLCFRLHEAGLYNVMCQKAVLYHHESVSRGLDREDVEKTLRLKREMRALYVKHPKYFRHDPFYNPNLHPNGINFDYAI